MKLVKDIDSPTEHDETAELSYFFDILDQFFEQAKSNHSQSTELPLTLIARSPESCIAKALYQYKEELETQNIPLNVIFSQIPSSEELSNWLLPEKSPCGPTPEQNLRWAKRPNLADAHEQLTLGSMCSWSGESMRRDINARFGVYIFEKDCPQTATLGQRSFRALWQISTTIPHSHFKRAALINNPEFLNLQNDAASLTPTAPQSLTSEFTRH